MKGNTPSTEALQAALQQLAQDPQAIQEILREAMVDETDPSPAASPTQEGEPTDAALWEAFEAARKGESQAPPQPSEAEGTTGATDEGALDEALWAAYERSWKGEDA